MEQPRFQEARRELGGFTAAAEKRLLVWLAARMPGSVTPDHLTALGLAAMAAAGAAYAACRRDRTWLHAVNLCLLLNWFGDSLDGTLARHRQKLRPRYGFYVDHLVDAFGALFLLLGLAASGLMHERVALGLPTELRILLAAINLLVWKWPAVAVAGRTYVLFDLVGVVAVAGIAFMLLRSAAWCARTPYRQERV